MTKEGHAHGGHGHFPGQEEPIEPFTIGCKHLKSLYEPGKDEDNKKAFLELGGGKGLCDKLHTDLQQGLSGADDDLVKRKEAFGENRFPDPPFESWWSLFFGCFEDEVLIILIIASIVSIVVNSIPEISDHPDTGYIDGLAIMIAVLIVATVTATNDYNKQMQFLKLSAESKSRIEVQVVRGGKRMTVGTTDVVVGDIVHLETGTKIPADGVVLASNDFKTNESAITGESDDMKKDPVNHPIVLSGTQVAAGTADYVVTAVGTRSMQGSIMADATQEDGDTPLQVKLDLLARQIGYIGMVCALGTFIAMMIVNAVKANPERWASWTVHSFIYGVTIIVVAIPEGLPLAVTISLAYSTRKMLADQNLIRHLAACETMGGATDICSDKTGTLTENRMTIVQAWLAGSRVDFPFSDPVDKPSNSENYAKVPSPIREQLRDQLALNSTAVIMVSNKGKRDVKGSKTEGAGLLLVESFGFDPVQLRTEVAHAGNIVKQYSFSSDRKMMSTIVQLPNGTVRMFTTGGSDFVLARCKDVAFVNGEEVRFQPVTDALKADLTENVIVDMAQQSLRTLGVAYKDFPSRAALPANYEEDAPEEGMTLYAIVGIKDPLRKDVKDAVAAAQRAGVMVRMVTGDNKITATAIAKECGIWFEGCTVIEGPVFRTKTPAEIDLLLPSLAVMARSSPKDKNVLVRRLNGNLPSTKEEWEKEHPGANWETERDLLLPGYREEWERARKHPTGIVYKAVVGVTGDGTNDAPALKASDVGLSMGISGTQVAMDASDIIILDDKFSSIVKAVMWGRCVYDNVQKFLQFQLTVNVVALLLTFISAVLSNDPPLNPIMMLWVNLIMDTMGALALGTEKPTEKLLDRKPYASTASLVLPRMWRHILAISLLQLATTLAIVVHARDETMGLGVTKQFLLDTGKYLGKAKGDQPTDKDVDIYISTFIFNAFVWAQIFNEFNARSLDDEWNVIPGGVCNRIFIIIIIVSGLMQALLVEVGGMFVKTSGLTGMHWLYTILLGALAIPMGIIMRFVPVPSRASDYATTYTTWFNAEMSARTGKDASITVRDPEGGDSSKPVATNSIKPLTVAPAGSSSTEPGQH